MNEFPRGKSVKIDPRVLVLSIHPQHASRILDGSKTVELRRTHIKVSEGDALLFYVSSPVKALKIVSGVDEVVWLETEKLWEQVQQVVGISHAKFQNYFDGAEMGLAIYLRDVHELAPIPLVGLRVLWPGFRPSQLCKYLTGKQFLELLNLYLFILPGLYGNEETRFPRGKAEICP